MNNNNIASLAREAGATPPFGSFGEGPSVGSLWECYSPLGAGVGNIIKILFNLADVLSIILPVLLSIAFMTIIERKQLAAHQRRVGPNTVG